MREKSLRSKLLNDLGEENLSMDRFSFLIKRLFKGNTTFFGHM